MFSVTYTGMNLRPLCTAIVCPTISGITVERRDQVLMTFFSPPRFMTSTFSSSGTSTKGPFLSDLDMLLLPSLHDETVGGFAVPGLVTLRRLTPWRHRMAPARRLAFTAAKRVVDRVHRHAAHVRALAEPAAPPCLADRHVLVIDISD